MRPRITRCAFPALLAFGLAACAQGNPAGPTGSSPLEPAQARSVPPVLPRSEPASALDRLRDFWENGPRYYGQAVRGHLSIWWRAQPVVTLIGAQDTDPKLRQRLLRAQEIRRFASAALALPDNGSYTRYVELGRPHVVWNVKATGEFSLQPRVWCFPFAGCVAYRGFYDRADAEAFAAGLRAAGDDVQVSGVPAYSTLGWMADPLLSSFIHYPEPDLAGLIFHELAHQRVYLKGDTRFNESFATAVEIIGVERWLAAQADQAGGAAALADWRARRERREQFIDLLARARARLETLYGSGLDPDAMRSNKAREIAALRADWQGLRGRWGQGHGYDRWFEQPIGNAHLVSVALYTDLVPAFLSLAAAHGDSLAAFYREVELLAALPEPQRSARLEQLMHKTIRPQADR